MPRSVCAPLRGGFIPLDLRSVPVENPVTRRLSALYRGPERAKRGGRAAVLRTDVPSTGPLCGLCSVEEMVGITHFNCSFWFGDMEHARVMRSMERFAREVLPAFR